jgi:hypothetical protein
MGTLIRYQWGVFVFKEYRGSVNGFRKRFQFSIRLIHYTPTSADEQGQYTDTIILNWKQIKISEPKRKNI